MNMNYSYVHELRHAIVKGKHDMWNYNSMNLEFNTHLSSQSSTTYYWGSIVFKVIEASNMTVFIAFCLEVGFAFH